MAMWWRMPSTLSTAHAPERAQLQLTADELASVARVRGPRSIGWCERGWSRRSRRRADDSRRRRRRLRRMQRLRADLGVNLVGAAIIVDLVERLEQMTGRSKESQ